MQVIITKRLAVLGKRRNSAYPNECRDSGLHSLSKVIPEEITYVTLLTGLSDDHIFRTENWWQSDAWPGKRPVSSVSEIEIVPER